MLVALLGACCKELDMRLISEQDSKKITGHNFHYIFKPRGDIVNRPSSLTQCNELLPTLLQNQKTLSFLFFLSTS